MKLSFTTVMFLSSAILCAENLLSNPSFEKSTLLNRAPIPTTWQIIKNGTLEKHHFLSDKYVLDGKYSAKLSNSLPVLKNAMIIWFNNEIGYKMEQIKTGTEMEFSIYATTDIPNTKCRVYLEGGGAYLHLYGPDVILMPRKWTLLKVIFKKEDKNYTGLYVCLQLRGLGTVYFDNAYFGKTSEAFYTSEEKLSY